MAEIRLIDPFQDPRWDRFVLNHPFGWIVHLAGWKRVLESTFSHMTGYYLVVEDGAGGEITAAMPLFEVKSWLKGNRMISIPSTGHCDPLISAPEDMEKLATASIDLSNNLGTSYIEIRSSASAPLIRDSRFSQRSCFVSHYLALDRRPEELFKTFHSSCVRKRIEQALSSTLRLKAGTNESDVKKFYQLYLKLRSRLGLPPQPYKFFQKIWETFYPMNQATLLLAESEGKTIAALMLLKFRDRVSALLLASDMSYRKLHPDHFLYWKAIKLAYNEGYGIFDFGRTSVTEKSLMDFKRRWGTETIDLPHYFYPKETSNTIAIPQKSVRYRIARNVFRHTPLPVLKLVGEFCYRHLG